MNTRIEILLVDDNIADVKLALHALGKHGEQEKVAVVRDGEEALEFLFGEGRHANPEVTRSLKLILLDLKLPKINGFEVLQAIKNNVNTKSIPVVVLTSSNQERDLRESYQLGANSFVQKPVDFDRFRELIELIEQYWVCVNHAPPDASPESSEEVAGEALP